MAFCAAATSSGSASGASPPMTLTDVTGGDKAKEARFKKEDRTGHRSEHRKGNAGLLIKVRRKRKNGGIAIAA